MANDVNVTIINNTPQNTYGLVFQQDPNLDQIFIEVFPTAWQVFKLAAKTPDHKNGGVGTAILPIQYEIGGGDTNTAFTGTVSLSQLTDAKAKWELSEDSGGFYKLSKSGVPVDNTIICTNKTSSYSSLSLLKNSKPLLTYPKVPKAAQATFLPINYIYVAWYTSLVEGSQILASISSPQAVGVNLDGAKDVVASLIQNPNTGERNWDIKVNGHPVKMLSRPVGRLQAFSVTEAVAA